MPNKNDQPKSRNSSLAIVHRLREQIIDRHIPPGAKLVERDLCDEFGVSRSIIREVLADLESQGLVEKKPNRGRVVRKVDQGSLFEILEIREVLEGLAARAAAINSKPEDWLDMQAEFGQPCEEIIKNLDFEAYLDLITRFRKRMVEAAQNEELSKLIDSIYAKIRIVQRRIIILPKRIEKGMEEHREVINALINGDPDEAEKMKRLNIRSAREYLREFQKWVL